MRCRTVGCPHKSRHFQGWWWREWDVCPCCAVEVAAMNPSLIPPLARFGDYCTHWQEAPA